MYAQYIEKFFDSKKSVPAQLLYDWRAVTGFVSGSDLHEIFTKYFGHPSPSGYEQLPIKEIDKNSIFFRQAKVEAKNKKIFLAAARFYDANFEFGIDAIQSANDVEELRRKIWHVFGGV